MTHRPRWDEILRDVLEEAYQSLEHRAEGLVESAQAKLEKAEGYLAFSPTLPDEDQILSWIEEEGDETGERSEAFEAGREQRQKIREQFEECSDSNGKRKALRSMTSEVEEVLGSESLADRKMEPFIIDFSGWEQEEEVLSELTRNVIDAEEFSSGMNARKDALFAAIDAKNKAGIPELLRGLWHFAEEQAIDGFQSKTTLSAIEVLQKTTIPFDPDEDPINAYLADEMVRLDKWPDYDDGTSMASSLVKFRAWCAYWILNFEELLDLYVASLDTLPIDQVGSTEGTTEVLFFDDSFLHVRNEDLNPNGDVNVGPLWEDCQKSLGECWSKIAFRYYPKLKFKTKNVEEWAEKFGKLMAVAMGEVGENSGELHSSSDLEFSINQMSKMSGETGSHGPEFYWKDLEIILDQYAVNDDDLRETAFDACLEKMKRMEELEEQQPHDEEEFAEDVHLMTWREEQEVAVGEDNENEGNEPWDEVETSFDNEDDTP